METTIVFILTSSVNTNSIKRIDEFVERGYKVKAYGFKRYMDVPNSSKYVDINILGSFKNNLSYTKRLSIIGKGIKGVLKETKDEHCIYYLIGLDIAMLFRIQSRRPYFFEEADLVHTNAKSSIIRGFYERIDKSVISHSLLSSFRSEGFVKYHFGDYVPENVCVITNRLNQSIREIAIIPKKPLDMEHLKIGYVGFIRYKTIADFAKVFCKNYPQHEFHFFGTFTTESLKQSFAGLEDMPNCYFHGSFKSPEELSRIYSEIDLVLSTYDVSSINVRYAEPNKIYEAIYFETPIIVSSNTFLSDKVKRMGIGFSLNAMDEGSVTSFVDSLTSKQIESVVNNMKKIDKESVINCNVAFFEKVDNVIKKLFIK